MDFEIICTTDDYWNYLLVITDYHLGNLSNHYSLIDTDDPDEDENFDCDVFYIPRAFKEHTSFNTEETKLLQELPEILSGEIIDYFSEAISTHALMILKNLREDQEHQKFMESQTH